MIISLALDVEMVTLAEVPLLPEAELGTAALVSKGATVFAPVIPYATPPALVAALKVTVTVTAPLDDQIAYQVSACLLVENGKLTLWVHVKLGDDVTVLTVTPPPSAIEAKRRSGLLVVVNDSVIVPPDAAAETEPSNPMLVVDTNAQTSKVIRLAGTVVALEKAGDHR